MLCLELAFIPVPVCTALLPLQVEAMDIDDVAPLSAALDAAAAAPTEYLQSWQGPRQQQQGRACVSELTTCKALAGSVVTSLTSCGSSLVATECLGSVTVIKALATPGGRVQLLPVGVEQSGLVAMDVVMAASPASPGTAGGAAGSNNAAAAAETAAAGSSIAAASAGGGGGDYAGKLRSHHTMLVASHPTGLLLLQRDLAAEQQHQAAAHHTAVEAWEAGGAARHAVLGAQAAAAQQLQVQQQLFAAAAQPWLGEGEAAPWAAGGMARPHQQQQQVGHGLAANRAGLAAAAAAAGEMAAAPPVATAREAGVFDPGAAAAPRLIASAACAPAPGISLMCAAQLGLHAQQGRTDSATGCSSGSSSGCSSENPRVTTFGTVPVWCFSASGGMSVVQMLQPAEAQALQQLQSQALKQQWQDQVQMLRIHPDVPQLLLRQLQKLPASASFRNFQRAGHGGAAGPGPAAGHQGFDHPEEADEELLFNCVDGDMLSAAAQHEPDGSVLHQLLLHSVY